MALFEMFMILVVIFIIASPIAMLIIEELEILKKIKL